MHTHPRLNRLDHYGAQPRGLAFQKLVERTALSRTRVLMTAMPPMLSDIVHSLVAEEAQVEFVEADFGPGADLRGTIARLRPDAVLRCSDRPYELAEHLLLAHPGMRLVTVSADARVASVQTLVPKRVVMHDISLQMLLDALLGNVAMG
jgi:hypothetical protein